MSIAVRCSFRALTFGLGVASMTAPTQALVMHNGSFWACCTIANFPE